jgi:hypothetical protein
MCFIKVAEVLGALVLTNSILEAHHPGKPIPERSVGEKERLY